MTFNDKFQAQDSNKITNNISDGSESFSPWFEAMLLWFYRYWHIFLIAFFNILKIYDKPNIII